MVAGRTVGRLWTQYLKVREELRSGEGASDDEARREAERQEGQLRDRLVVNYSPLVKYVASRVGARVPGAVEQEDMISWGVLGLLSAIETYDPNREGKRAKFESYAISKIRWAILDQLRSQDWVPRRVLMRDYPHARLTGRGGQDKADPGAQTSPLGGRDRGGTRHRDRGVPRLPRSVLARPDNLA
jgi:hypothetical protein